MNISYIMSWYTSPYLLSTIVSTVNNKVISCFLVMVVNICINYYNSNIWDFLKYLMIHILYHIKNLGNYFTITTIKHEWRYIISSLHDRWVFFVNKIKIMILNDVEAQFCIHDLVSYVHLCRYIPIIICDIYYLYLNYYITCHHLCIFNICDSIYKEVNCDTHKVHIPYFHSWIISKKMVNFENIVED